MMLPRCPHCHAQGLDYVALEELETVTLVYCQECGAIHGAVPCPQPPLDSLGLDIERLFPVEEAVPASHPCHPLAQLGNADLSVKEPLSAQQVQEKMSLMHLYTPGSRYMHMVYDDGPPHCLTHKIEMRELVIPAGYLNAGRRLWVCPNYEECQSWLPQLDDDKRRD